MQHSPTAATTISFVSAPSTGSLRRSWAAISSHLHSGREKKLVKVSCCADFDCSPQFTAIQNSAVHFLECVFCITRKMFTNHSLTSTKVKGQLTVCRRIERRQIHGFRECGCELAHMGQLRPTPLSTGQ